MYYCYLLLLSLPLLHLLLLLFQTPFPKLPPDHIMLLINAFNDCPLILEYGLHSTEDL